MHCEEIHLKNLKKQNLQATQNENIAVLEVKRKKLHKYPFQMLQFQISHESWPMLHFHEWYARGPVSSWVWSTCLRMLSNDAIGMYQGEFLFGCWGNWNLLMQWIWRPWGNIGVTWGLWQIMDIPSLNDSKLAFILDWLVCRLSVLSQPNAVVFAHLCKCFRL